MTTLLVFLNIYLLMHPGDITSMLWEAFFLAIFEVFVLFVVYIFVAGPGYFFFFGDNEQEKFSWIVLLGFLGINLLFLISKSLGLLGII